MNWEGQHKEVARILLADHFDKVVADAPVTGDVLIDKAIELLEKKGWSISAEGHHDRSETIVLTKSDEGRFVLLNYLHGDTLPELLEEDHGFFHSVSVFVDRELKLGVTENLPTLKV